MTIALPGAPFPVTYRELWLPPSINNNATLPSSVEDSHSLTLTGARKGTTCDGVHFTGAANSNIVIAANAIQNAQQAFHLTIRFKLDTTFTAGAASNFYLFQKILANDWIRIYLNAADGLLRWEQGDGGGGTQFQLTSTTASWTAGVWYVVTVSLTSTPTQRLLVNGIVEDTDTAAAVATPNGGDLVVGNSIAAGVDGVIGIISWVVIGVGATAATALIAAEEQDLSKGVLPPTAKVQYELLLDEGRGVTTYDRGSAGGNGTIGSVCTWAWGQTEQPCLSPDGINDVVTSSIGINISGSLSLVWVGKMKSTYTGLSKTLQFLWVRVSGNNLLDLGYSLGSDSIQWNPVGGGVGGGAIDYTDKPAIDDYLILIGTLTLSGITQFFINGFLAGRGSGVGIVSGAATAYIGCIHTAIRNDISKPLLIGLIDGALSPKQARAYSRYLKNIFNLSITI